MPPKRKPTTTQSALPMMLGATALAGVIALGALSIWQANQTNDAISALTDQVRTLAVATEKGASFGSKEAFAAAVRESIEVHEQQQLQANIDAKYAGFELAEQEPPNGKWIYGSMDARFTLVEFSDMECPYCKRFHSTPKKIVDASNGSVNWQWQHLPLGFHNPAAIGAAEAAECVGDQLGNQGFWVFTEEYFNTTRGNGGGVADLNQLAISVGADSAQFSACLSSDRFVPKIQEQIKLAQQSGINGTPATYIVDNYTGKTQLLGGAQPPEAFASVMRRMVAQAKEAEQSDVIQ